MNRQQRREAERLAKRQRALGGRSLPTICPPGQHAFGKLSGTFRGEEVAARVVCSKCRRTFEQVCIAQPEVLEDFKAWRAAGSPDEWPVDSGADSGADPEADR